MVTATFNIQQ